MGDLNSLCTIFFKMGIQGFKSLKAIFLRAKKIGRLGLSTANKHLEMSKKVKYTKDFP